MDDTLMTFEEFCEYLKIGKTKGRELIKNQHVVMLCVLGEEYSYTKSFLMKN